MSQHEGIIRIEPLRRKHVNGSSYRPDILLMLNRGQRRLTVRQICGSIVARADDKQVSLDEIRAHNRELADGLLNEPYNFVEAFDTALKNVVKTLDRPAHETSDDAVYYCAYIGSFGEFSCNPRSLSSTHLNHMVSLEGIVTKTSLVRPKVVKSVHYSEAADKFHFVQYFDQTMTMGAASTSVYPTEDDDKNPVCTERRMQIQN